MCKTKMDMGKRTKYEEGASLGANISTLVARAQKQIFYLVRDQTIGKFRYTTSFG